MTECDKVIYFRRQIPFFKNRCVCPSRLAELVKRQNPPELVFCRSNGPIQKVNRNCPWKLRPPVLVVDSPKLSLLMLRFGAIGVG